MSKGASAAAGAAAELELLELEHFFCPTLLARASWWDPRHLHGGGKGEVVQKVQTVEASYLSTPVKMSCFTS